MFGPLVEIVTKILVFFGGAAWLRHDGARDAKLKSDNAADRRMDDAEMGIGATDDERRRGLHDLAAKWKRG
jgi:hypothetical protein